MQKNELYRLFHKRWTQQITKEEAGELSALLHDEKIRDSHDELYNYWIQSKNYHPKTEFNADFSLARLKKRIASEHTSSEENILAKIMRMKPNIVLLRIAAAMLLLIFCAFILYTYLSTSSVEIITDNASVEVIDLPDGSKVWLNANSVISYPKYDIAAREVKLKGEAYFEVAHNPEKPFIVNTSKADVKVIGTAFNLAAYQTQKKFELNVDEGIVQLIKSDEISVEVSANEQVHYDYANDAWQKLPLQSLNSGAWKDKILRFENSSLSQVFQDLQTFYNIRIDDSNLLSSTCQFTSPINRSVGDVIQALQTAYPDLVIEGPEQRTYRISGKACE